jgi:phytoene synthase
MLDGVEMDLHYDAYPSFKELSLYCQRVGSAVSLLGTEILGYEDRRTPQFANNLGMALQLV